jgi:hypothetical protein
MIAGSDRERARQLAHREILVLAQPCNQRAPGRVGKRPKGPVKVGLILNHVVKYRPVRVRVNRLFSGSRPRRCACAVHSLLTLSVC